MSSTKRTSHGYYICHCCVRYKSHQKIDLIRHFEKKYKCSTIYKTSSTREELRERTLSKRYIFDEVDFNSLTNDDIIFIIENYLDNVNQISANYRSKQDIINKIVEQTNTVFPNKNDDLTCYECFATFTQKSSLARHIASGKQCATNRLLYENKQKRLGTYIKKNAPNNPEAISGDIYVNGDNNYIGNVTNNTLNNQTNVQSTTKIEVRDFIHDIYDHSHLTYDELPKDFFVLSKFLDLMMENKVNHNVVYMDSDFSNAIVFTRDDLRMMPSDKMGYTMLEKLHKTMLHFVNQLHTSKEEKKEISSLHHYYRIITNKYRCDTLYKEYDANTKTFYPTQQGSLLRSRDEYLADIKRVLNKHRHEIRENIFQNVDPEDIGQEYIMINPNIEDFASTRARYRDMKS